MKRFLSLLLLTLFACYTQVASATYYYHGRFFFRSGTDSKGKAYTPVCYAYAIDGAATTADVNDPLRKNEVFRALLVRDTRVVTLTTPPSVAIDAAGQIVKLKFSETDENGEETEVEYAVDAKWMNIRYQAVGETDYIYADYITVGDVAGVPHNVTAEDDAWDEYGFEVYTEADLEGDTGNVYLYLVAFDTRMGTDVCEGEPKHVQAYAMTLCPGQTNGADDEKYPAQASPNTPREWNVGVNSPILIYWPGCHIPWQAAAEVATLEVTQEGAQVTLEGDAVTDYLTPNVEAFAQTTNEDGDAVLSLSATAPDVLYYTLYTKSSLADSEWRRFEDDDFVKNLLDETERKQYTRFRIDGESPLTIPVIEGETTRFYLLRGE